MAAVRAVLIAIMVLVMAVTPLLVPSLGGSSDSLTAYASFAGGTRTGDRTVAPQQNGNDNDDDNNDDDDDDDNDDDDNDNGDDDDDDGDDNDNDDGDDNDNADVVVVVKTPNDTINKPTKCFDTGEVSVIQLGTGSYDVTVSVMPHSSFGQTTRMTLRALDPSSVPSPGALVDSVVFQLDAQSSCDGVAIGTLPNWVNMGIIYNVTNTVDKSKLQIVKLEGSSWTNVDTIPDPNPGNPYVSTTIMQAGTYALIQRP